MPKHEHHEWVSRHFHKGVDQDTEQHSVGTSAGDGRYTDARNMRISPVDGDMGSIRKIGGEDLKYDSAYGDINLQAYVCIGTIDVNGRIVEFWCHPTPGSYFPRIHVDGILVAYSEDIPFLIDFPLQLDKNENCQGGEVFITDYNSVPMILNVGDMVDAQQNGEDTYFGAFNPNIYQINLTAPLDIPIFRGLELVGGGGGLPVGQYSYAIRYSNQAGDRTNWGPETPRICVPRSLGTDSVQYPGIKTYGDDPNVQVPTQYGIALRFRVTNLVDYDFIEVRRSYINSGEGIDGIPTSEIVARIDVADQEVSIRDWIDPSGSNVTEDIDPAEGESQLMFIKRAKTVRYYDKRHVLMNIEVESRDMNLTFDAGTEGELYAITKDIGQQGHNDPVNNAYYRALMNGERYGWGIVPYDGIGSQAFTIPIPGYENFQIKNRREEKVNESLSESDADITAARASDNTPAPTFEAFSCGFLSGSVAKQDLSSYKSIKGNGLKLLNSFNFLTSSNPGQDGLSWTIGGQFNQYADTDYAPYRPFGQDDNNVSGHDYRATSRVGLTGGHPDLGSPADVRSFQPIGFGPKYHATGVAVHGISGFPSWVKAFSVVRTKRAGRVVCQGLAGYRMYPSTNGNIPVPSTKDLKQFQFISPDLFNGVVPQVEIDNMIANPSEYKLQFVSPLGFFSEAYSAYIFDIGVGNPNTEQAGQKVDLISYARITEETVANGEFNHGEPNPIGQNDSGYVGYGYWRNDNHNPNEQVCFDTDPEFGNALFDMGHFELQTNQNGTQKAWINMDGNLNLYSWNSGNNGLVGGFKAGSSPNRFHEPVYVVNIIKEGANIPDDNTKQYVGTGHYQKLESLVGISNGNASQQFELVDERPEDCMQLDPAWYRYSYIELTNGSVQAWMDISLTDPNLVANTIYPDIINNGFWLSPDGVEVYGLYSRINDTHLLFDQSTTLPLNAKVYVRYDSRSPVRVFGGDTCIGEHVGHVVDVNNDSQFNIGGMGMPYSWMELNPRVLMYNGSGLVAQTDNFFWLSKLRQHAYMWTCQSYVNIHLAHELEHDRHFPATHYVMRPNEWSNTTLADQNIPSVYEDQYPDERFRWAFGGIKGSPQYNFDYAAETPYRHFSKPEIGFEENTLFCTMVAWSPQRNMGQQDSPGLKTFNSLNTFILTDDQGEIKRAYDATSGGKGENLYAFCNRGICLLLTNKSILSTPTGGELATTSFDNFIGQEYWLTKEIGMTGELWRIAAEDDVMMGGNRREGIFFADYASVYRMINNDIKDIGNGYKKTIRPILAQAAIQPLPLNYCSGVFDRTHEEYWMQIGADIIRPQTFVFSSDSRVGAWVGRFGYVFDRYLNVRDKVYGMKDLKTYELDEGYVIDGEILEGWVEFPMAQHPELMKEFARFRCLSDKKPTEFEGFDSDGAQATLQNEAIGGPLWIKEMDAFEHHISRRVLQNGQRRRFQGQLAFFRLKNNLEESFSIKMAQIQIKPLK